MASAAISWWSSLNPRCRKPAAIAFSPAASGWFQSALSVSAPFTIFAKNDCRITREAVLFHEGVEWALLAVVSELPALDVVGRGALALGGIHPVVGRHAQE